MSLKRINLPKADKVQVAVISEDTLNVRVLNILTAFRKQLFEDATDLLCAVNIIQDFIDDELSEQEMRQQLEESLDEPINKDLADIYVDIYDINENVNDFSNKEDATIALTILLLEYDHVLNEKDREEIISDYADDGFNVSYNLVYGLWMPQLNLGYSMFAAA